MRPMLAAIAMSCFLAAGPAPGDEPPALDAELLKQQGLALHDQGRYDEAIARYKQALTLLPGDPTLTYELALSLHGAKRYLDCVQTVGPLLESTGKDANRYHSLAASCTDVAGDPARAAEMFDEALRRFPDDGNLLFNAGVTRLRLDEPAQAKELLKRSVEARPEHPGSHLYLGMAFDRTGFEVPAILAHLRFLMLAPADARAAGAAETVMRLLEAGVKANSGGGTEIVFDPDASQEEGDYSGVNLARQLGAASWNDPEKRPKSRGEKIVGSLDLIFDVLGEKARGGEPDFARRTYLPVFRALRAADLLEPFVYVSFRSLEPATFDAWLERHPKRVEALRKHLNRS